MQAARGPAQGTVEKEFQTWMLKCGVLALVAGWVCLCVCAAALGRNASRRQWSNVRWVQLDLKV